MKRREKIVLKIYLFHCILFFGKLGVMLGKGAGLNLFFNSVDLHFINVRRGGDVGLCKLPAAKTPD